MAPCPSPHPCEIEHRHPRRHFRHPCFQDAGGDLIERLGDRIRSTKAPT